MIVITRKKERKKGDMKIVPCLPCDVGVITRLKKKKKEEEEERRRKTKKRGESDDFNFFKGAYSYILITSIQIAII